jgi:hypothetical protein
MSVLAEKKAACTSLKDVSYYVDPHSRVIAFMLVCSEKNKSAVYEIVYAVDSQEFYFVGTQSAKDTVSATSDYWEPKDFSPSMQLNSELNKTVAQKLGRGVFVRSVRPIKQLAMKAGNGTLVIVEVTLNDGSTLQSEMLFVGGSWICLGMNEVVA